MCLEIATIDHCILSLVLKFQDQENLQWFAWQVFGRQMVIFHPIFDNIRLKFSTHIYFMVLPCGQNS